MENRNWIEQVENRYWNKFLGGLEQAKLSWVSEIASLEKNFEKILKKAWVKTKKESKMAF